MVVLVASVVFVGVTGVAVDIFVVNLYEKRFKWNA